MTVDITELADQELSSAYDYYANIDPDLAWRFLNAYHRALRSITLSPRTWLHMGRNIHRRLIDGFPYAVFYEVHSDTHVTIHSVFHLKRKPRGKFP